MAVYNMQLTVTDAGATATLKNFQAQLAQTSLATVALQTAMNGLRTASMLGIGALAGLIVPTVLATNMMKDYDATIRKIGAIGGPEFSNSLEEISDKITQLSIDAGIAAEDLASGFYEFTKAGVSLRDIMGGLLEDTAKLAVLNQTDFTVAVETVVQAWTLFGKSMESSTEMIDMMSAAANASLLNIEDLTRALQYAGGTFAVTGSSFKDFISTVALLSQVAQRSTQSLSTYIYEMLTNESVFERILGDNGIISEGTINWLKLNEILVQFQGNTALTTAALGRLDKANVGGTRTYRILSSLIGAASELPRIIEEIEASQGVVNKGFDDMKLSIDNLTESLIQFLKAPLRDTRYLEELSEMLRGLLKYFEESRLNEKIMALLKTSLDFIKTHSDDIVNLILRVLELAQELAPLMVGIANKFLDVLTFVTKIKPEMLLIIGTFIMMNRIFPMAMIQSWLTNTRLVTAEMREQAILQKMIASSTLAPAQRAVVSSYYASKYTATPQQAALQQMLMAPSLYGLSKGDTTFFKKYYKMTYGTPYTTQILFGGAAGGMGEVSRPPMYETGMGATGFAPTTTGKATTPTFGTSFTAFNQYQDFIQKQTQQQVAAQQIQTSTIMKQTAMQEAAFSQQVSNWFSYQDQMDKFYSSMYKTPVAPQTYTRGILKPSELTLTTKTLDDYISNSIKEAKPLQISVPAYETAVGPVTPQYRGFGTVEQIGMQEWFAARTPEGQQRMAMEQWLAAKGGETPISRAGLTGQLTIEGMQGDLKQGLTDLAEVNRTFRTTVDESGLSTETLKVQLKNLSTETAHTVGQTNLMAFESGQFATQTKDMGNSLTQTTKELQDFANVTSEAQLSSEGLYNTMAYEVDSGLEVGTSFETINDELSMMGDQAVKAGNSLNGVALQEGKFVAATYATKTNVEQLRVGFLQAKFATIDWASKLEALKLTLKTTGILIASQIGMFAFSTGLAALVSGSKVATKALGALAVAFGAVTMAIAMTKAVSQWWLVPAIIGSVATAYAAMKAMQDEQKQALNEMQKESEGISIYAPEYQVGTAAKGGFIESEGLGYIHEGELIIPKPVVAKIVKKRREEYENFLMINERVGNYVNKRRNIEYPEIMNNNLSSKITTLSYPKIQPIIIQNKPEINKPVEEKTYNDNRTFNIYDTNRLELDRALRAGGMR